MHLRASLEQSGGAKQPSFFSHVLALPLLPAVQAPSAGHAGGGSLLEQSCAFEGSFKISKVGRTQLFPVGVSVMVRDPRARKRHL